MLKASHSDKMDKVSNNSELSDDSGVVDWIDQKSIVEENKHKLESQVGCDVTFVIGDKKEHIQAHKSILVQQSSVFKNMFHGPDGKKQEHHIPDICADSFWELLRHVYCGDEKLQVSNVVGILHAADRFDLIRLRQACLQFLQDCLEVNNACYLLVEARKYGFSEQEKIILSFIRKNHNDVIKTRGMDILTRELLNEVLTLPGVTVDESLKKEVVDKWAINFCEEKKQEVTEENIMDSLQDCLYVYRDDSVSHRYVMDSVTSRNLFEDREEPTEALPPEIMTSKTDDIDGMSTISSVSSLRSRSSVHTYRRLPSTNMWADVEQVTRLQELYKSDINDATHPDAISFTVDRNLYLYGFSIYGPKKQGEGKYQVDTILYRKKKEVVMETIHIKGAGVILPVMFERPVKVDRDYCYTLEVYIKGPESHMGASGQTLVQHGPVLFTFSNAKVKRNRTDLSRGQIPRLYFLLRQK
ncbi:unnamed protein product [Candidula unifasciata]|uniref:BTB domain-containing protein n=1 Tax=Candidula unifasciata TaxID=100452 RepID=A0A8S3ZTF7_9EUPU|nr:unnamed protein product [Candidula unifasciata]